MAASRLSHVLITSITRHHFPVLTQVRTAIYPAHHQQPTFSKEELAKPLEDSDPRKFQPIRAAANQHTSSLYYDEIVQKFTRMMMKGGNRERVQDIMERTLENLKRIQVEKYHKATSTEDRDRIECNPVAILHIALENCKPALILTKVIKGGVSYQVPIACNAKYKQFKAMKWIIESCRDKERKLPMENKLAWEIIDAYHGEGKSIRKKQDLHRQCEANKAYAHYRW